MSGAKPTRLHERTPPPTWTIADVSHSEFALGRSRWWMFTGSHWLAVGASQAMSHVEFAHRFREAVLRVPREREDRLVATLRTPIPVGGLHSLGRSLEEVYGSGLEIQPFDEGEFARVEFGPRGDPKRTRRINEPAPRIADHWPIPITQEQVDDANGPI